MFKLLGRALSPRTGLGSGRISRGALAMGALAAGLLLGRSAQAEPCFSVDEGRDTLSAKGRKAAGVLFEDALRQAGEATEGDPCPATWHVAHVKLGRKYTVIVSNAESSRRMRIRRLDDAPSAYSQLIGSLQNGEDVGPESASINRNNVTDEQTGPRRRYRAELTWHLRLGYGLAAAPGAPGGPSFGIGFRRELDRFGIEGSFLNYTLLQDSDGESNGGSGSVAQLMAFAHWDRLANNSPYVGLGVGFGGMDIPRYVNGESIDYTGRGLNAHAMLGYSFFRASNMRLFFQADAVLPTYLSRAETSYMSTPIADDERYTPLFLLSMGVGWGKTRR